MRPWLSSATLLGLARVGKEKRATGSAALDWLTGGSTSTLSLLASATNMLPELSSATSYGDHSGREPALKVAT